MENIKIRQATTTELVDLQKIGKQTFFETFASSNSEENMQKYLEEGFSREVK